MKTPILNLSIIAIFTIGISVAYATSTTIDGTISQKGCNIINGTISQVTDVQNTTIQVCNYHGKYFKLVGYDTCILIGFGKVIDPQTGRAYSFPSVCDIPATCDPKDSWIDYILGYEEKVPVVINGTQSSVIINYGRGMCGSETYHSQENKLSIIASQLWTNQTNMFVLIPKDIVGNVFTVTVDGKKVTPYVTDYPSFNAIPACTSCYNMEIPVTYSPTPIKIEINGESTPPVIINQVELGSAFALFPDNQTCTSPPMPGFINNCLTSLVPGHKVQCGFFIGSNTCEPIRQYSSGTNQSCFSDYPASSAPQWFDVYNTLNTTIHLQNFTVIEKWNQRPYGNIGPYSTVMEIKPNEKCTVPIEPIDEPLAMYLNNMSMEITYHYSGKDYNVTTPSLSDTYNDSRTWQFDGNKWIFAEQNTIPIPEFPFTISVFMASIASLIIFYRIKFK